MAVNTSRSQGDELVLGATEMSVRQVRPDRGGASEGTSDALHQNPTGYPFNTDTAAGKAILRGVVRGV